MSDTLYERYTTNDDGDQDIYGNLWRGQTFTIGNTGTNEDHNITSVKLLLYRIGSPGTITVSIKATSEELPTGDDLASGTTNGDTLPTESPYEWREITFGTPYTLSASTKYAICVRISGGDTSNAPLWRIDKTSSAYTGGDSVYSINAGGTWYRTVGRDMMFMEYGIVVGGVEHTHSASDTMTISDSISVAATYNVALADTLGISDSVTAVIPPIVVKKIPGAVPRKIGLPTAQNVGVGM